MRIFVSDLHLGCGDSLEDFALWDTGKPCFPKQKDAVGTAMDRMHRAFERFIDYILCLPEKGKERPELVFLGDTFDLLQVFPEERKNPAKIDLIAKVHKPFFTALYHFRKNGGIIRFVVGNHDHDLLYPSLFGALKRHLPFQEKENNLKLPLLFYHDPNAGIYAEHGNQFDSLNAFRNPGIPEEWPFGSELVLRLVNPLEQTHPMIDNLGLREALWHALSHAPLLISASQRKDLLLEEAIKAISYENRLKHLAYFLMHQILPGSDSSIFQLLWRLLVANEKIIRHHNSRKRYIKGLLYTFSRIGRNPVRIFQDLLTDQFSREAIRILEGKTNRAIGHPFPAPRFVLFGHTHRGKTKRLEKRRMYINTGSWRMRAVPYGRYSLRYEQPLDFAIGYRNKKGRWIMKRRSFADVLRG